MVAMSVCAAGPQVLQPSPFKHNPQGNVRHLTTRELTRKVYGMLSLLGQKVPGASVCSNYGYPMKPPWSAAMGMATARPSKHTTYAGPHPMSRVIRMQVMPHAFSSPIGHTLPKTETQPKLRLFHSTSSRPSMPTEMAAAMARVNRTVSPHRSSYCGSIQYSKEILKPFKQFPPYTNVEKIMPSPTKHQPWLPTLDTQNLRKGDNKTFDCEPTRGPPVSVSAMPFTPPTPKSESSSSKTNTLEYQESSHCVISLTPIPSEGQISQKDKRKKPKTPRMKLERFSRDGESSDSVKKELVENSVVVLMNSKTPLITRNLLNPPPSLRVSSSNVSSQVAAYVPTAPLHLALKDSPIPVRAAHTSVTSPFLGPSNISSTLSLCSSLSKVLTNPELTSTHSSSSHSSPTSLLFPSSQLTHNSPISGDSVTVSSTHKTKVLYTSSSCVSIKPQVNWSNIHRRDYTRSFTTKQRSEGAYQKLGIKKRPFSNRNTRTGIPISKGTRTESALKNKGLFKSRKMESIPVTCNTALPLNGGERTMARAICKLTTLCKMPISMPTVLPTPSKPGSTHGSEQDKTRQCSGGPMTKNFNIPMRTVNKAPQDCKAVFCGSSFATVSPAAHAHSRKRENITTLYKKSQKCARPRSRLRPPAAPSPSLSSSASTLYVSQYSPILSPVPLWPSESLSKRSRPWSPRRSSGWTGMLLPEYPPGHSRGHSPGWSPGRSPGWPPGWSQGCSPVCSPAQTPVWTPGRTSERSPRRSPGRSPGRSLGQLPVRSLARSQSRSPGQSLDRSPVQSPESSRGRSQGLSPERPSWCLPGKSPGRSSRSSNQSFEPPVGRSSGRVAVLPTGRSTIRPMDQYTGRSKGLSTGKFQGSSLESGTQVQSPKLFLRKGRLSGRSSGQPKILRSEQSCQSPMSMGISRLVRSIPSPASAPQNTKRESETWAHLKRTGGTKRDARPKSHCVGVLSKATELSGLMLQLGNPLSGKTRKSLQSLAPRKLVPQITRASVKSSCLQSTPPLRPPTYISRVQLARTLTRTPPQDHHYQAHAALPPLETSAQETRSSTFSTHFRRQSMHSPNESLTSHLLKRQTSSACAGPIDVVQSFNGKPSTWKNTTPQRITQSPRNTPKKSSRPVPQTVLPKTNIYSPSQKNKVPSVPRTSARSSRMQNEGIRR